jgi:hypothetical protein
VSDHYFKRKPDDLLTVVDENNGILGFAYNDKTDYSDLFRYMEIMENYGIPCMV